MLTKKDSLKNEVKTSRTQKSASQADYQEQQTYQNNPTTAQPYTSLTQTSETKDSFYSNKANHQKTKITIKYNVGYGNQVYIRGNGANLNWNKGIPLKNVKADEWVWETETPFTHCEFKTLINDKIYENGENHYLNPGASIVYTPHFPR